MKIKKLLFLAGLFITITSLQSCNTRSIDLFINCNPIKGTKIFKRFNYISIDNFSSTIKYLSPKKYNNPTDIYKYKNYILIKENQMGLHIIDSTNPEIPNKVGFITVPLLENITINDNTLLGYTNSDILSIDITDITNPKLISLVKHNNFDYYPKAQNILTVGFKEEQHPNTYNPCDMGSNHQINAISQYTKDLDTKYYYPNSFSLIGNNIYKINRNIEVFNINESKELSKIAFETYKSKETIYYGIKDFKNYIFLKDNGGIEIFNNKDIQSPDFIKKLTTDVTCNASVFHENTLYISGQCQYPVGSRMDIMDFSNINEIRYVSSFLNLNPIYIYIKDNILFVGDKSNKLKIFDLKPESYMKFLYEVEINDIKKISSDDNFNLLVTNKDEFYQYNFSNIRNGILKKLSYVKIEKDDYFKLKHKIDPESDRLIMDNNKTYYYKWYKEYFEEILPFKESQDLL